MPPACTGSWQAGPAWSARRKQPDKLESLSYLVRRGEAVVQHMDVELIVVMFSMLNQTVVILLYAHNIHLHLRILIHTQRRSNEGWLCWNRNMEYVKYINQSDTAGQQKKGMYAGRWGLLCINYPFLYMSFKLTACFSNGHRDGVPL